jgi:hypothetical protein
MKKSGERLGGGGGGGHGKISGRVVNGLVQNGFMSTLLKL